MRITFARLAIIALASTSLVTAAACGGGAEEAIYATLQECVIDHTVNEGFNETQAITICLTSHLEGINLATQAECEAYVTANGGYPDSRVAACADYLANK